MWTCHCLSSLMIHWWHAVYSDNRDVDETISWIKEKEQLMASDDFGRDLASVQALLRKHEGLERDLAALEDKVTHTLLYRMSAHIQNSHEVKCLILQCLIVSLVPLIRSTHWVVMQNVCRRHIPKMPPRFTWRKTNSSLTGSRFVL